MADWLDGYFENKKFLEKNLGKVSVRSFGANGDGIADDTAAIQASINYVQSLITDRFIGSYIVFLPSGTYKITSTLVISQSGISVVGEAQGSSILYAPNATFDLMHFDGSILSLYQVGAMNLRFYTPTNATAGCHLRATRVVWSIFQNLHFMGWYDGLISDGCGKVYYDNVLFSQHNRTAGTPRYAIDFKSTANGNSDIHVSNYQIMLDEEKSNYTVIIRGGDGIYFTNGHQHGAVLVQPSGSMICSSFFWNNVYFDTSPLQNFIFSGGTTGAYRNFWFNNCYFRDSTNYGMFIDTTSTLSQILINNCTFAQHPQYGIYANSVYSIMTVNGCMFSDNNQDNIAGVADIRCNGETILANNYFIGGGVNGRAVTVTGNAQNCIIEGNSFVNSTAGTKISDSGINSKIRGNTGYSQRAFGQATITNPATSIVVNHGLAVTPNIAQISLTFNDAANGVTRVFVSNVTSTQFTINSNATPTTTALIGWSVNTET